MRREAGDGAGVTGAGQVVPQHHLHRVAGPRSADDDEAVFRHEPEQLRDEGEQGGGRARPGSRQSRGDRMAVHLSPFLPSAARKQKLR